MNTINVLAIDDSRLSLRFLEQMGIGTNITVDGYQDIKKALEVFQQSSVDVVLVDYVMPEEDGIQVIKHLRQIDTEIPIILITAIEKVEEVKVEALKNGATDFWSKNSSIEELKIRVTNLAALKQYRETIKTQVLTLNEEVNRTTHVIRMRENETLDVLRRVAKYKDHDTGGHIERVGGYAQMLAEVLGMDCAHKENIYYGAQLHDIGKIGIQDHILCKPSKLSAEEYNEIKRHAEIGYQILRAYESPYLKIGSIISLTHHERYDGKGYPRGLQGKEIPIEGRIVAIADTFDALVMKRVYKSSWSFDAAMQYLKQERNLAFDGELVDYFLQNRSVVEAIYHGFQEGKRK